MDKPAKMFTVPQPLERRFAWQDAVVLLGVVAVITGGVSLAVSAPKVQRGPEISLAVQVLPYYAALSVGRMAVAYALPLLFALVYGRAAARYHHAEQVLMPLLDVLQSVPILSFLPVVLLSFSAILPQQVAAELASIVLIFTSQVWNLVFAWYQALKTIPNELREAAAMFGFTAWLRFRVLELPFAAISLIWNSMMSWAGGWFFLMAAEIFTVGQRDFRLTGLGAYLREAADRGDVTAIGWGIGMLVLVIVILDQCVWRPLLVWSVRFKLEMVAGGERPSSWFYRVLRSSQLMHWGRRALRRLLTRLDDACTRTGPGWHTTAATDTRYPWGASLMGALGGMVILYGIYRAWGLLIEVTAVQWLAIAIGVGATTLRVLVALLIALAWTVPLGVAIGTRPHLAARVQPVVQIAASVPATALFPVVLLWSWTSPGG